MLILFDIDMTLLETDHIGITLLENAGRELFHERFTAEGINFGGCLDPVIIAQMLINNTVDNTPDNITALRRHYHAGLQLTANERPIARALPGAHELVAATRAHDAIDAIGVLTGNYPETGAIKLTSAGFDPSHFEINAWGDASPHAQPLRSHLPPVAIQNFHQARARAIDPDQVIIIGDTIHDVTCALDNGCRALAVATGHATRQELEDAGAHIVVDDLTETNALLDWMLNRAAAR
ncbi:MAG: HAD hydrolase-like protein [Phycisphaerales bacterium]|nr:HAD hydrolase-like protein [Phycisphaerales bacterium]